MKKSNILSVTQKNRSNFKIYILGFLLFFGVSAAFGQAFTTSWPLSANLTATSTGSVTPATAVITSPLFYTSTSFPGAGLLGTGTGGKATTSCSATYNSVGGTPIYPFMEFRVSPTTGNYLTIAPFSFTVSSTTLVSGMTINAGYSIDGGTTFTALTFTASPTSIGATANTGLSGSVFSTSNATTFSIASNSTLTCGTNKDFIVRIVYWRNNLSGSGTSAITISSLNLTGFSCPGSLTATPTSLSNFNAVPTSASASQSFSVSGSILSGNVIVTPPTGYEINNPAVDGNYYSSITLTPSSGTLAPTSLNIRIKTGQATGVYNGNVTITNTNAPTQTISLSGASYTNYYYNGVGALHSLTSWGTNSNGTGANPPDFGSDTYAQAFYIVNTTNVSTTAPFTIGSLTLSTNNRIIVGNGSSAAIIFTMTAGNPLKVLSNSKFNVLAPLTGSNELIFQDSSIPTVNSPDPSTNLTYANGQVGVSISGSTYNQLKITNTTSVSLTGTQTPVVKFLFIDSGSSLIAPSSNFITLTTGGNAVINGSITGSRSQGIFTTDPTSATKGTVFSADTSATMTLGCSSTVIYNRGSAQTLSPLNYANLTIINNITPTATTVSLAGAARINGIFSFTGSVANTFNITTGTLTFGLNATLSNSNSSVVNFGGQLVTLETNSTLVSGVNLTGVTYSNVTTSNVVGTASSVNSLLCKGQNATINLASSTGTIQWQQSSDNIIWANISLATTNSYSSPSLSSTTYYRANVTNTNCSTGSSNVAAITINNKKWNGSSWDGDTFPPIATESIEFQGNYTSTSDITACSCTVTSGIVTIGIGNTLNLTDALYVNGGSMNFESTASLVQTNGSAINTCYDVTKLSFQRITPPLRKFDYTFWSSPVSAQSLLNLSPGTLVDKYYTFDSVINNWVNVVPSTIMSLGRGYIVRGPQLYDPITATSYTANFYGIPNNGTISTSINGASGVFNSIGNPYPSAIDAELFYQDNSTIINPNFYFWTHITPITANNYTSNDYAIYNAVLGAGIGAGAAAPSGGNAPDRYIDAEQGFFVEGLGNGSVDFKNTQRVSGSNNTFYRPQSNLLSSATSTIESNKFWLNITNDLGLFKQQLICYVAGATNEFDNLYDAKESSSNEYIQFNSLSSTNDKCAIQSRVSPFVDQDIVPLGFSTMVAGNFTITLDHFDGLFTGQNIYLYDNDLGLYANLKQNSYEFTTVIGSFNDRFSVRYTLPSLQVHSNNLESSIHVFVKDENVTFNSESAAINNLKIYDVLGRTITGQEECHCKNKTIHLNNAKGLIFAVIELDNGTKIIKKVYL